MQFGQFEWDEPKNNINLIKHGVTFQEASTVFEDRKAVVLDDYRHSTATEDRFIIIGQSKKDRLLMVCHCYRCHDEVIRIISARKATKSEFEIYGGVI